MSRPVIPPARSAGYALVLVLIGVALLSLLVETALFVSTSAVHGADDAALRARLDAAAQAGIAQALLALSDTRPAQQWPVDGTPRQIIFAGAPVRVAIFSALGQVDLNGAARPILFSLFAAAGLDQTDANIMADRVLDWREPGNLKRLNGAKAADYRAAGLNYGPRGAPFQTVDELNLVLGMTPALYATLAPDITVYSVLPTPQPQAAPALVLRARGTDAPGIAAIMAARAAGQIAPNTAGYRPPQGQILGLPGSVFTITATASLQAVSVTHTETIRFTGNPQNPFWILAWR